MFVQETGKNGTMCTIPPKQTTQKMAETKTVFWHIDRNMLPFKLHFFLFIGALGTALPYITIFGKNRIGITASSQAAILTTQMFLLIFTKPAIGYIADYFNKLKATICILSVIQTIFFFLILLIPKIDKGEELAIQDNSTHFLNSYEHFNSSLYLNCPSNGEDSPFSEVLSMSKENQAEFCFISLDNISILSDECQRQHLEETTESEIQMPSAATENYTILTKNSNSSLPISIHTKLLSTCKVCCKSNKKCQNIQCDSTKVNRNQISSEKKFVSDFETYQFWTYALLTTLGMCSANGLFTLSDTACCESVEKYGSQFGRQRLYGAVGWGLMSAIGGLLNDYTNDFTAAFILMSVMSVLSLVNMLRLNLVSPSFSNSILKDIGTVLKSKEIIAFKFVVLLNGVGSGVVWYYLVWYLTTIGGSRFLCGLVHFVQCLVGEIPFMFFSGWFIKKIGHFNILSLSLISYCIRFFWYSRLRNPWIVLPAEVLHGFTYGIYYPTLASYAKLNAKPGTEATTQALLFTTQEGLGAGIGCVVVGLGFDNLGGERTFFILSVFSACGLILSIILHLCIRRQKGKLDLESSQKR